MPSFITQTELLVKNHFFGGKLISPRNKPLKSGIILLKVNRICFLQLLIKQLTVYTDNYL